MIIDIHGYAVAMPELYSAKAHIFAERGWGLGVVEPGPEVIARCARWNVEFLDQVGTDLQLLAPRPYHLSCGREPAAIVRQWTSLYNRVVSAQCDLYPTRLRALAALPQSIDVPPAQWVEDLSKLVEQHDFVGVILNPDPGEGDGTTPGLGDPYWYPVWEALVQLDLPALIVSGVSRSNREGYSSHYLSEASIAALSILENPALFRDFPNLKIIITYGGGSLPYQIDRWRARRARQPHLEEFDVSLRRLYFDTVVHSRAALEMLFSVCGSDRCLFGTQRPGAASAVDVRSGRAFDDLKPQIEGIELLSDEERAAIFSGNARRVFTRLNAHLEKLTELPQSHATSLPRH